MSHALVFAISLCMGHLRETLINSSSVLVSFGETSQITIIIFGPFWQRSLTWFIPLPSVLWSYSDSCFYNLLLPLGKYINPLRYI